MKKSKREKRSSRSPITNHQLSSPRPTIQYKDDDMYTLL